MSMQEHCRSMGDEDLRENMKGSPFMCASLQIRLIFGRTKVMQTNSVRISRYTGDEPTRSPAFPSTYHMHFKRHDRGLTMERDERRRGRTRFVHLCPEKRRCNPHPSLLRPLR